MSETNKERYVRLKAMGMCVSCAVVPAWRGRERCEACCLKARLMSTRYRARRRVWRRPTPRHFQVEPYSGLCKTCHKAPGWDGRTQCQRCTVRGRKHRMQSYYRGRLVAAAPDPQTPVPPHTETCDACRWPIPAPPQDGSTVDCPHCHRPLVAAGGFWWLEAERLHEGLPEEPTAPGSDPGPVGVM